MTTRTTLAPLALLGTFALLAQADTARADASPERVFHRCVEHLSEVAARCTARNAETVQECLPVIKRLLNAGRVERARQVARRCITKIEADTDECIEHVRQVCRRCIDVLLDLDAPELARRLAQGCDRVTTHLNANRRRAINAIIDLF